MNAVIIAHATAVPEIDVVRVLMTEYGAFIAKALGPSHGCHTSLADEIANVEHVYAPPRGFLLLAMQHQKALGCIAVHEIAGNRAEIKRLWVRPEGRGLNAGAALLDAALQRAAQLGYAEAVLDTMPSAMPQALRLYMSRGFEPTDRFNDNPVPGVKFYRRSLP